jgi:colanic acid biosynthesis glycosyl transferase WcaI
LGLRSRQKLHVWCQFFYPELISTGQVITELFERLSNDFDIEVWCAQPTITKANRVPAVIHHKEMKVVRLWSSRLSKLSILGKVSNQVTYSLSLFWKALLLPRGSRVNVFTDPFFLPLLLLILYPLKRFNYTVTLFDLYPETLSKNKVISSSGLTYRLLNRLTNTVYYNAKNVITIGRCMQKIVSKRPIQWKGKPEYIPIWCDSDNIRQKTLPENYFRRIWEVPKDTFLVGYSGNLAKFHPIETFLTAAMILEGKKDIKFIFVGEGAKKNWAQSYCEKNNLSNCLFQSYVDRNELGSLLNEFDCGLVGLNKEQTGLSVPSKTVALMTAGLPIIACVDDTSETALMIQENKCGYICPTSDSSKLADFILKLKEDPNDCILFGENATLAANKSFQITDLAKMYADFLKS